MSTKSKSQKGDESDKKSNRSNRSKSSKKSEPKKVDIEQKLEGVVKEILEKDEEQMKLHKRLNSSTNV